jgi:hypothetical protein
MKLQVIKKHWNILKRGHKIAVLYGGTRSGKTYSILQYLFVEAMRGSFRLASIVSRSFSHINRGALREFREIIGPVYSLIDENKTFLTYKFPTGAVIEFFSADTLLLFLHADESADYRGRLWVLARRDGSCCRLGGRQ